MQAVASPTLAPRGCTNRRLRQFTRRVSRLYDEHLAQCGLKTSQYSLLATIERMGPVQPAVVARELSLDPSTLTRNLQPLATARWVLVDAGPDGRSHLLTLTPGGKEKFIEARACWKRAQHMLNDTLGARRVAELHQLIDACEQTLEQFESTRGSS